MSSEVSSAAISSSLVVLFFVVLALVSVNMPLSRRYYVGTVWGLVGSFAVADIEWALTWMDKPGPSAVLPVWTPLSIVVLAVGGILGWSAAGRDPSEPARSPLPGTAARLNVGPTDHLAYFASTRAPGGETARTLVAFGMTVALCVWAGVTDWDNWGFAGGLLIFTMRDVLTHLVWRIRIGGDGITLQGWSGWPRLDVALADVEQACVVDGHEAVAGPWFETDLVVCQGPAMRLDLTGGRHLIVSAPDADTAVRSVNTLIAQQRSVDGGASVVA